MWLLLVFVLVVSVYSQLTPIETSSKCTVKMKLEVLPGRGWDNLQNKDMGQIFEHTYNKCKTTEDGEYLIPDHVSVIPIKQSNVDMSDEMFEHYMNYTSITARGFKVGASATFPSGFGISGSFSDEYQHVKNHQLTEKSVTNRVQIRNVVYTVLIEPNAQLEPSLKKFLTEALYEVEKQNIDKARVLMEFVVRDYGTHYLSRVDAGAILYEQVFLKSKWVEEKSVDKSKIGAAVSANFLGKWGFSSSFHNDVDQATTDGVRSSTTSSSIHAIGGCMVKPNMSIDEWISKIPNNLVSVDRSGELITFILEPLKFPNVSLRSLGLMKNLLKEAVEDYYNFNTHKGCVSMDSPNFDATSNVDDGSCHAPLTNFTFGGVYQKCTLVSGSAKDICDNFRQINPLTGTFSCPAGYKSVPLVSGKARSSFNDKECHKKCKFLGLFCHQECNKVVLWSTASYDAFWCAAEGVVKPNSGMMFGGLFTPDTINPVTSSATCPSTFISLKAGEKLKICVSNDYELGYRYSIPFGGFFSCSAGNPLVTAGVNDSKLFDRNSKSCPRGHSQHMATIDNGCEINYCVQSNAFGITGQIPVVRPPFRDTQILYSSSTLMLEVKAAKPVPKLSGGSVAGIAVGCVALVSIVIGLLGYVYKRKKNNRHSPLNDDESEEPLISDAPQYGSVNDERTSEPVV